MRKYQNTQKSSEKNHAELRSVRSSFRAESKERRAPYSEELGVRSECVGTADESNSCLA